MANNQIAYIELPATDLSTSRRYYADLFGWTFVDLGDAYSMFQNSGIDGGMNPHPTERTKAPLVLIESDDAAAMQERVRAVGSTITMGLFDYPGGKRFHFLDPSGNEVGVFQNVA